MAQAKTRRERRAASIENILQASLKLFVSQGYKATTVEDIARCAALKGLGVLLFQEQGSRFACAAQAL